MKTLALLAIVATLGAVLFTSYNTSVNDSAFQSYIAKYGRNYASQSEYEMRREIFNNNLKKIEEHNAQGLSYTLGVNQFSDWTDEEYSKMLGLKNSRGLNSQLPLFKPTKKLNTGADVAIDWVSKGYVTPVKNQARCGSCWAFSAAQAVEGAYFKKYGFLPTLSEQHAVDCDFFSHGCNGGLQENAFIHWMKRGPINETNYPYEAVDNKCREGNITSDYPVLETAFRVDVGDDLLYEALQHQPVAISIRAENDAFRQYTGGVIDGDACGTYIDHAVLLTGFEPDESKGGPYWIVKNSWGSSWGENGYVRIKRRGGFGICGINQQNSIPVYEDDY